ncbi:MAG: alcohol dehydrogenase catalytic domain-containing protein, partial [Janthinobacterium lividum]
MKALRFDRHGAPDVLFTADVPAPVASADTAIVKVLAASINPSDVKNVAGRMTQTTLPRTPGRDYSGIVVDGPAEWLGAEVWGSGDTGFTQDGSHAALMAVPVASLRRKPATLSHEEAASI